MRACYDGRMDGRALRDWRERHGYGLRPLAARLGVSLSTIQRWEAGETIQRPEMLRLALRGIEAEMRAEADATLA